MLIGLDYWTRREEIAFVPAERPTSAQLAQRFGPFGLAPIFQYHGKQAGVTLRNISMKPGRNDPCPCGSGKKYKHCCLTRSEAPATHKATQQSTESPEKLSLLASLYNSRNFVELERQALSYIQQYPESGLTWKMLASSLHAQGKNPLHALQMAASYSPNDAESHYNLGFCLEGQKRFDEAVTSYSRALKINPSFVDAHFNQGNSLRDLGRLDEAVASYRRAVKIRPDYADVHCNLGSVLRDLGQLDQAMSSFQQALALKPTDADFHFNMGNVLKDLDRLEDAVTSYRRALALKPDYTEAYLNLGDTLRDLLQLDEAAASYRRALEINPGSIDALNGLGDLCVSKGDMDTAKNLFRQTLAMDAGNIEARFSLAMAGKVSVEDENLAALEAIKRTSSQAKEPLPERTAIRLNFVLGKCYDDLKQYDRAFLYFLEGCRLKRATYKYDAIEFVRYFDSIMRAFDKPMLNRLRGSGNPSQSPIFVLGMPRSGTTLTEQIIASHPEVHGAGELPEMPSVAMRLIAGASYPENMQKISREQLAAWGSDYISGLQKRAPAARHITDKLPGNFIFIGLIHLMLPNAKIIHVKRNPVDTCLSCFTQLFNEKNKYSYDLSELGSYYVQYARLMEYWRNVLPAGSFLDVFYEDIVANMEIQARSLIEYCGLEWNDTCLDFHKNTRAIQTASATQVRQPIYNSSVEKWRNYEKFLTPLLDALGDLVPGKFETRNKQATSMTGYPV